MMRMHTPACCRMPGPLSGRWKARKMTFLDAPDTAKPDAESTAPGFLRLSCRMPFGIRGLEQNSSGNYLSFVSL